jgi:hypothetical protein
MASPLLTELAIKMLAFSISLNLVILSQITSSKALPFVFKMGCFFNLTRQVYV